MIKDFKGLFKQLGAYKYVLLVVAVGLILLLWPNAPPTDSASSNDTLQESTYSLEGQLEEVLAQTEGVGRVSVLLTRKRDIETQYVYDTDTSERKQWDNGLLTLSETNAGANVVMKGDGSGNEQPLVKSRTYPVYQGALVVCDGAANPDVRLKVMEAVAALTNLGYDKITVAKMKS